MEELKSIVPENVGVIALTATATKETLRIVVERLSFKDPIVIGLTPTQAIIVYNVEKLLKHNEFSVVICYKNNKTIQRL